jgi:NADH-quinone oxidoreductase subunit N
MILAVIPELGLVILALLVLGFDLVWKEDRRRALGWLTAGGMLLIAVLALVFARPAAPGLIFGGMLRNDWLSFTFRMVFLFGAAITALFAMDMEKLGRRGEFYLLLITATLGMSLMASSADLVMLYLAIETTSIPLYVLAGFLLRDERSMEASFKYFLFGALTSTVMLYGFSLVYGFTGTTQIYTLAAIFAAGQLPIYVMVGLILLLLVGFGFKVAAVPFHFWAPDVYEGSPSPVAGFLSTASKAAGFAVLMRFLLVAFPTTAPTWSLVLAVLSTASMLLGNVLALSQKNIKRLLAYSSIAQAGYMLIGLAAVSSLSGLGFKGTIYYLIAYLVTNLAAFGVVSVVGQANGSDEISTYAGLSRRSPGIALALMVAFLSLGGIPPFGGFVGKVLVIAAAINANLVWLAAVGIFNSIIGLYYYLTVVKVMYLNRSDTESLPLPLTRPWRIALVLCVAGILLLGVWIGPWFNWAATAVATIR